MKKIIPFTSDIKFNTKIYEITSISLEHNLTIEKNNIISGEFIVSGDYKMNDSSINTEPFIHGLPFDITLDTKYDMDRMKIDIDDFKFEIINEEILRVNIDVLIEGIELVELDGEEIKPDLVIESRSNKEIEKDLVDLGFNKEDKSSIDNLEDDIISIIEDEDNGRAEYMDDYKVEDLFKQDSEIVKEVSNIEEKEENAETSTAVDTMESIFNNFNDQAEKYVTYYVHIVRENDNIDSICLKYGVSLDEIKEYNNIDQITLGSKIIVPYATNETI